MELTKVETPRRPDRSEPVAPDATTVNQPFSERLRQLRIHAGLTQEDLAEASGVSRRAISDLERSRVGSPQRRSAEALADALLLEGVQRSQFLRAAKLARWLRSTRHCEHYAIQDHQHDLCTIPTSARYAGTACPACATPRRPVPIGPNTPTKDMSTVPAVVVFLTGNNHPERNALAQQLAEIVRAHFPNGQLQMHLHHDLAQAVGL